jgi:hypothetical protein
MALRGIILFSKIQKKACREKRILDLFFLKEKRFNFSGMKEYMTSRERVYAALNFQIPDRVPLDLGGFQTGIHKKAYIELLKYLQRDEEIVMLDPVQQLVRPSEEILQLLHIDFRYITGANIEILKQGGGYVYNNVHNIQAGVPHANIIAMDEADYHYGFSNQ